MASDKATQLPFTANTLFTSNTDARLTRLSKILSTSSGVDATLTLVGYGLFFASSQIHRLETLSLHTILSPTSSPSTLKHGTSSFVKLAELESSMKALAGMCSDFRTFTRLWGLLGVYAMAKRNYVTPEKDGVLRGLSYSQTLSLGTYYIFENGYYLAGKGVLKGWKAEDVKRWAKVSMRCFLAYVMLEFVRLYRVRMLREKRKVKGVDFDSDREGREGMGREEEGWWRGVKMNVAYAPLSAHWASEGGVLTDGAVGALMSYVGWMKFGAAWAGAA